MSRSLPFAGTDDDAIDLAVVDLRVARAFWEGVPTARLLARIRLERDERDVVDLGERATGAQIATSTWDKLMAQLLAAFPPAYERVKRTVARHGRAASDEGPLVADDPAIAALVHVLLSANEADHDSSPAEGAADGVTVEASVMRACGRLDERLGASASDRRAPAFEACLQVATLGRTQLVSIANLLAAGEQALSPAPLYPWGDADVPVTERRALLLERKVVAAAPSMARETTLLASHHGHLVALVELAPRSSVEAPVPPSSWMPSDFGSLEAAKRLAGALERGATTAPRARAVILRGGDAALEAIGREMLNVTAHPFASAVFADILGRASRERDVVRLVSYFAIAPDVASAAHALAVCTAPEVATVLRAWLESILPSDRTRCIEALAPYPHLHAAVKPLLARAQD
jgi:hypothetical protein